MKDLVKGKGIYAWQLSRLGGMPSVIETLKKAGMTHIIPKISDGNYEYVSNSPYLAELVSLAHDAGIKVVPYQYVYGAYPESEAIIAIKQLRKYPYDGFVINAERQYRDLSNPVYAARLYSEKLREAFPDLPLYLSTYRYPSLHRTFPFDTFLYYCDAAMPQVYWMQANGTVPFQLKKTLTEYSQLGVQRPVIPTGAAFKEHGWAAIPQDQVIFIEEVERTGLEALNWWEYYYTFILMPQLGQAIIDTPFKDYEPPTPIPTPEPEKPLFKAKCLVSQLKIRSTPRYFADNSNYVGVLEKDDIVDVYEEVFADNINWFKFGEHRWCSGHPIYMQKIEIEEPPDPPQFTDKERLDILWNIHYPDGYKED